MGATYLGNPGWASGPAWGSVSGSANLASPSAYDCWQKCVNNVNCYFWTWHQLSKWAWVSSGIGGEHVCGPRGAVCPALPATAPMQGCPAALTICECPVAPRMLPLQWVALLRRGAAGKLTTASHRLCPETSGPTNQASLREYHWWWGCVPAVRVCAAICQHCAAIAAAVAAEPDHLAQT